MNKILIGLLSILHLVGFHRAYAEDQLEFMQKEIKHIVIVMAENRSFDNMLAWLYDEDHKPAQFIPSHTTPHYLGLSESTLTQYTNHLKNSRGNIIYSCPPIKGIPSTASTQFINSPKFDPNEPFPNVNTQIFGDGTEPNMSGFLQDYASLWHECEWESQKEEICAVMETYTDKELPIFHSLARHYAVSDYWFSSVPTQTNPNRAFAFCGSSEGEIVNGLMGKNNFLSDTVWNRLHEQSPNTTWAIFWQSDMVSGIYPGPYSELNFPRIADIPNYKDHFLRVDQFHKLAASGQLPDISFIEPQWTLSLNLSPKKKEAQAPFFVGHDFILGLQGNDFHPPGDMRTGENFLANIYTSLIANPESWANTLLIITFDEHGGLFDHISPPPAISPNDFCQHGFYFDRYGVRIPTLLISPKIDKSVVIRSEYEALPFDHTSLIAMILKWRNVDQSKWNMGNRVENAPTFESIFTRQDPRSDAILYDAQNLDTFQGSSDTIRMGDSFYLKDNNGNYLCKNEVNYLFGLVPYLKNTKIILSFDGSEGNLMHGSFCLIKSTEANLGVYHVLETSPHDFTCFFGCNSHNSNQWWTIKSVDHPYLGSPIKDGDKIFLENHIYYDLIQCVPCRLTTKGLIFEGKLKIKPISYKDCDQLYWTIEKV